MPVRNGEKTIRQALESLLTQTWADFVLVISDNASTDNTGQICQEYAVGDPRIRYVRQPHNIGAEANFHYVFHSATSEYFMWAADDDVRSPDFLERNLSFLQENKDYVASTCPTRFHGRDFDTRAMGDASLADEDRYLRLLNSFGAWHANGRFYSLLRREIVAKWIVLKHSFLGSDWTLITHLAMHGKFNRLEDGWVELGAHGISNTTNTFASYRRGWVDWILPFRGLSADTLRIMHNASIMQRARVLARLAHLNLQGFVCQLKLSMTQRAKPD
jgi:glycosyltransferase involved in cell wall biosynthesis